MILCNPQHAADAVSAEHGAVVGFIAAMAPHFEKVAIARCADVADKYSVEAGAAIRGLLKTPQENGAGCSLADLVADRVARKIAGAMDRGTTA